MQDDVVEMLAALYKTTPQRVVALLGPNAADLRWFSAWEQSQMQVILQTLSAENPPLPFTREALLSDEMYVWLSRRMPKKIPNPGTDLALPFRVFFLTLHPNTNAILAYARIQELLVYPNAVWGFAGVSVQNVDTGEYHVHAVIVTDYYTSARNMESWFERMKLSKWSVQPVWSSWEAAVRYVAGQTTSGRSMRWFPQSGGDLDRFFLFRAATNPNPSPNTQKYGPRRQPDDSRENRELARRQHEDPRYSGITTETPYLALFRTGIIVKKENLSWMLVLWESVFMGIGDVYAKRRGELAMNADHYNGEPIVLSQDNEDLSWLSGNYVNVRTGAGGTIAVPNNVCVIISTTNNIPPNYTGRLPWLRYVVRPGRPE